MHQWDWGGVAVELVGPFLRGTHEIQIYLSRPSTDGNMSRILGSLLVFAILLFAVDDG